MTFDEFTRVRLPALLRFAKAVCAVRGTAEDVVQEVLLRACSRWEDIARLDQPETYVRADDRQRVSVLATQMGTNRAT